jgi:hypothetical protein
MTTAEILLLTGSAIAALGIFALGVLVGTWIGESRAARAYVDELAQLERPATAPTVDEFLIDTITRAFGARPDAGRGQTWIDPSGQRAAAVVQPRPVSVDNDPTQAFRRPELPHKRHHRRA